VEAIALMVPIAVAMIGGPVMFMLARFDKRNTEQHMGNMDVLKSIEGKVEKLDERFDAHIEWHLKDGE
jgi:hypothetical protein